MVSSAELEEQLDVWSQLAGSLEEKLKSRTDENERLKRNLRKKSERCDALEEDSKRKTKKISDLQSLYKKEAKKVEELNAIIDTRQPAEVGASMKLRAMERVENSQRIEGLESQVKTCKAEKEQLMEERESLSASNAELFRKLNRAASVIEKMKGERERNSTRLLEMGDIVRTLNCLSFDEENSDDSMTDTSENPNGQAVKNIKRKIEAFDQERRALRNECKALREDNESKDKKIIAMESFFHSANIESRSEVTDESAATEKESSVVQQVVDRLERDDSSDCYKSEASDDSSFSTLDPPDVPLEKYEALKREYQSSLEKVLELTEELFQVKQTLNAKKDETPEQKVSDLQSKYDNAIREISVLEKKLEVAKAETEDLGHQVRSFNELQEEHQKHKQESSLKMENLEKEVTEQEQMFRVEVGKLKQQFKENTDQLKSECELQKSDHLEAMSAQKKQYDDLNYEFETFLEDHTKLEDDLAVADEKYKEALKHVVALEDQVNDLNKKLKRRSSEGEIVHKVPYFPVASIISPC